MLLKLGSLPMIRFWLPSLELSSYPPIEESLTLPLRADDELVSRAPVAPPEPVICDFGKSEVDPEAPLVPMMDATSRYLGWLESAMSKRGWMTSGGNTVLRCHRFRTRITLLFSSFVHW